MAREKDEEEGKQEQPAEEAKKRKPLLIIIIAVVAVLVLGGGGFVGYKMLSKGGHGGKKAGSEEGAGAEKQGEVAKTAVKNLDAFIVNLTDAQGTRYLKAVMQLELDSEVVAPEIEEKMPMLRDEIISILSSKSFEDVSTEPGKRELKKAIIERVNRDLKTGRVTRVFFTEFVVQ